jgi:hypothetical protein
MAHGRARSLSLKIQDGVDDGMDFIYLQLRIKGKGKNPLGSAFSGG